MRGSADDPGTQLREAGWRQGSILSEDSLAKLGFTDWKIAVVVSQDCNVVQTVDLEPTIEILLGVELPSPRPEHQHGKHPRVIDISLQPGTGPAAAGFHIRDKKEVPKKDLAGQIPSRATISALETGKIARWIAKRYTRPAFPDAFNRRLEHVGKRLDKLSKRDSSASISGIYLVLEPRDDELPDHVAYSVSAQLTVPRTVAEDPEAWAKAMTFQSEFEQILESCQGLQVTEVDLRSERDVSIDDLRSLKRLDLDHRSIAEKPGGAIAPAESEA